MTTSDPFRADLPVPRQVLVPLDGSALARRAAGVAEELAGRFPAALTYLTVVLDEPLVAAARDELQERAAGWALPRGTVTVTVGGDPATSIVTRARHDVALVVMATHGRGRVASTVLGSMAERVVRDGGAPVVVVGPRAEAPYGWRADRLVVCLDGSPAAETILPWAASWARTLQVPIELVHVVDPAAYEQVEVDPQQRDVLTPDDLARTARRLLDADVPVTWHVLHDRHPASAILRHLQDRPHSLVLLVTRSRRGLARLTLGSVAAELVKSSPAPVALLHTLDP